MVLSTEEHRQDTHRLVLCIDFKPVNRAIHGQVPESRQNVVVEFTSVWRSQNSIRICANFKNPCRGTVDRTLHAFANTDVAINEVVEDQLEITLRLRREFKTERNCSGTSAHGHE